MSDTHINPSAPQPLQEILRRTALPLLLFAGVLFSLLLLSYILLLPRFTRLHKADGTALSPRAIAQYERSLAADLTAQEEERIRLVLPVNDDTFDMLKERKRVLSLPDVKEQLIQAAARLGETQETVVFTRIAIDGDAVTAEGDVRNVGTRSMTVLAAYIEELTQLPFVSDLERPGFSREQLPDGSFRSPFTLRFRLIRP
jgi:hypothetical protein